MERLWTIRLTLSICSSVNFDGFWRWIIRLRPLQISDRVRSPRGRDGEAKKKKTPDLRLRYVSPQRVGLLGLFGLKIARTQTLFYFSFRSFQKISECWRSINILWFLFWRENRGSVNRLVWKRVYALPILVWNWVWFSRGLRGRMNVCYCFNSKWMRTK